MNIDISSLAFTDADGFYEALLNAHEGLAEDDSNTLNAQLVLLLANRVADPAVLKACVDAARAALPGLPERFVPFIGSEVDEAINVIRKAGIVAKP